jgi:hypothetical protein
VIEQVEDGAVPGHGWISPGDGQWSVAAEEGVPGSVLLSGPGGLRRIHVPDYIHRPLEARWIKPGILHLVIWFNPHYGAYAVLDVESGSVILSEQLHDGTDTYNQWLREHGEQD